MRKYRFSEALAYLTERLGYPVSAKTFRSWVTRNVVPYYRNPGRRGHYVWTDALLDEIAEMIKRRKTNAQRTPR